MFFKFNAETVGLVEISLNNKKLIYEYTALRNLRINLINYKLTGAGDK
jgi:hypothetical protein